MSHFEFIGNSAMPGGESRELVGSAAERSYPAAAVQHFEATCDDLTKVVPGLDFDTFQTKPSAVPNRRVLINLGETWLCHSIRQACSLTRATVPDGYVLVVVPLENPSTHVINGLPVEPDTLAVCGSQAGYLSRNAPGKSSFSIVFRQETVLQALRDAGCPDKDGPWLCPEGFKLLTPPPDALRDVRQMAVRISTWARKSPHLLQPEPVRLAMGQSLCRTVARAWLSATPLWTCSTGASCASSVCHRADAYFEKCGGKSVYIPDACAALGLSPRALQSAFQRYLGVQPTVYLRLKRLHQVHTQLQARPFSSKRTMVKSAALDSGFRDLSRFASYYHDVFGALPHETSRSQSTGRTSL